MKNLTLNASTAHSYRRSLKYSLSVLYSDLNKLIKNNERLLLHHEEVGDTVGEPLQVILFGMGLLNLFLKQ